MSAKRFCRVIRGEFFDPNIGYEFSLVANYLRQKYGYKPYESSYKEGKNRHLFIYLNDAGVVLQLSSMNDLMMHFITVCAPSDELLKVILNVLDEKFKLCSYDELTVRTVPEHLVSDPRWLPALVKGTINDTIVIEEVLELIRINIHSENEEVRKYAVIAAFIDEVYFDMFKDLFPDLRDNDSSPFIKDFAKRVINNTSPRPAVRGLLF